MTARFDELELFAHGEVPVLPDTSSEREPEASNYPPIRVRRALAFLADGSLFAAPALASLPLIETRTDIVETLSREWVTIGSLAGFLLLFSFYYFVGCWLLWGRTVGGAIFDLRLMHESSNTIPPGIAVRRWTGVLLSLASGGAGFLIALLPGGRSIPDLISRTGQIAD